MRGKDNLKKLRDFLYYLNNHDTRSFIIADKDERVKTVFEDYIREGLLKKDHYKMWNGDFEDLFESNLIITAMQKISQNQGLQFDMTTDKLEQERKKSKKVADILPQHYRNKTYLNKPLLAEELASDIVREIYSRKERQETQFEKEIKNDNNAILIRNQPLC